MDHQPSAISRQLKNKRLYGSLLIAHCSLLASCAPQTQPSSTTSTPLAPVLIEGGLLEGRQVRAFGLNVTLPSAPAAIARRGDVLYVGYPFQLLFYRGDVVQSTVQLPGIPLYVKARPLPLVGLENGLFVPGQGTSGYKAKDAVNTRQGIYWLDNDGVNLERRRVVEGEFSILAASEQAVYAFGREGVRVSDGLRFPLPRPATAALVLNDVYVVSTQGIVRLNSDGLRIGSVDGVFRGLESDGQRLYSLRDGRLVTISLDLRLLEVAGQTVTPPVSFGAVSTTHPMLGLASPPDARSKLIDESSKRPAIAQGGARTAADLNLSPLGYSLSTDKFHTLVDRNNQGGTQGRGEGLELDQALQLGGGVVFNLPLAPSCVSLSAHGSSREALGGSQ